MIRLQFDNKEDSLKTEFPLINIDELTGPKTFEKWYSLNRKSLSDSIQITDEYNYVLKGDNLPILYGLLEAFEGKIKLIYIDPPYNTGKSFFGYSDRWRHEDWLIFMKNRLEVAQKLMHETGTIFISIGAHEMAYLKVLCDEIFDRKNYVGEIIWETASDNNATQITNQHEYVLCYAKERSNLGKWKIKSEKASIIIQQYEKIKKDIGNNPELIQKELRAWIKGQRKSNEIDISGVSHYTYVDDKGVFYPGNSANTRPGGYDLKLPHPVNGKFCKQPENGYRWPAKTFWEADARGDVLWPKDEKGIPKIKKRIETATELLKGYFYEDNRKSTKALTAMIGEKKFHNPKSLNLLKKIIRFASDPDDMVLDFFGGSGTTAHAIIEVNSEDLSNRRFLLIEKGNFVEEVIYPRLKKVAKDTKVLFGKMA